MLELRPNCERCDTDIAADSPDAFICTFECTFCLDCTNRRFAGVCPNCGGELVRRPVRPAALLERFAPSTERVTKPHAACKAG